jgi:transposase
VKGTWVARRKILDCSSKRFSTDLELGVRGVIYRNVSAPGKRSINVSADGAKSGVFERIFKLLSSDCDNEYMMIDATIVRASTQRRCAKKNGAQAIGRSRGGLTTKVHALVDVLGNPCNLMLTPGQDHDLTCAQPLLENGDPRALIGDKAYDAESLIDALDRRAITPVIPPKANRNVKRDCDFALYCERNLVERFFNKIKHYQAIAARYDKLARNFLAAVQLVAAIILLN